MTKPEFTPEAQKLWARIPQEAQAQLMNKVWCARCLAATTITNPTGEVRQGDLLLSGTCARCDGPVARLIEHD